MLMFAVFPLPQNMTAIWYGSGIVIVSWLPVERRSFDYTVVWCKGLFQCEVSSAIVIKGQVWNGAYGRESVIVSELDCYLNY